MKEEQKQKLGFFSGPHQEVILFTLKVALTSVEMSTRKINVFL